MFLLIILNVALSCEKDKDSEFVFKGELKTIIEEIADNDTYIGAEVNRYVWNGQYVYELSSPLFCVGPYYHQYDANGIRIDWQIYDLDDYIRNRTDKTLIWAEPEPE